MSKPLHIFRRITDGQGNAGEDDDRHEMIAVFQAGAIPSALFELNL
jgi:hypothetical protein